jgi:hypothetical protein
MTMSDDALLNRLNAHRSCSRPLQRVVVDFGADIAFAQVMDKLVEHYGILVAASTIRRVTELHARNIYEMNPIDEA